WLAFTNEVRKPVDGFVTWIKPSSRAREFYPAGFTNQTEVIGSLFRGGNGVRIFNTTNAQVWLANGNLPSFTNYVALSTNNVATGTNKLTLQINSASGSFKGSMLNPETGKTLALNGVVLTNLNASI